MGQLSSRSRENRANKMGQEGKLIKGDVILSRLLLWTTRKYLAGDPLRNCEGCTSEHPLLGALSTDSHLPLAEGGHIGVDSPEFLESVYVCSE